jgi:hypothetical protein
MRVGGRLDVFDSAGFECQGLQQTCPEMHGIMSLLSAWCLHGMRCGLQESPQQNGCFCGAVTNSPDAAASQSRTWSSRKPGVCCSHCHDQ